MSRRRGDEFNSFGILLLICIICISMLTQSTTLPPPQEHTVVDDGSVHGVDRANDSTGTVDTEAIKPETAAVNDKVLKDDHDDDDAKPEKISEINDKTLNNHSSDDTEQDATEREMQDAIKNVEEDSIKKTDDSKDENKIQPLSSLTSVTPANKDVETNSNTEPSGSSETSAVENEPVVETKIAHIEANVSHDKEEHSSNNATKTEPVIHQEKEEANHKDHENGQEEEQSVNFTLAPNLMTATEGEDKEEVIHQDHDWAHEFEAESEIEEEKVIHDPCDYIGSMSGHLLNFNLTGEQVQGLLPYLRFLLDQDDKKLKEALGECMKKEAGNKPKLCQDIVTFVEEVCAKFEGKCDPDMDKAKQRVLHALLILMEHDYTEDAMLILRACAGQADE